MVDDNQNSAEQSEESPPKPKLTPEERAALWAPEWAAGKPQPVNKGVVGFLIAVIIILLSIIIFSSTTKREPSPDLTESSSEPANSGSGASSTVSTTSSSKALRILQEQKAASEKVTRQAVELIKANRMAEVRQLYKNRWNELATLRTNVTFDRDLTAAEKENIDQALRSEQESVTGVLAKYDSLYGP